MADEVGIMDITDTPDVAVWAKGIRKSTGAPSDMVKEPSKLASMTLHRTTKDGVEIMVDPANKKEVAKAIAEHSSMTDESGYGR